MAKKKKQEMVEMEIRVDNDTAEVMKAYAERCGVSVEGFIQTALFLMMKEWKRVEGKSFD